MRKIKWGVIGCGGIADIRTIPGLLLAENAELTMVMDRNPKVASRIGQKYGVLFTDNIEDLLAADLDVVYIATPVFCHKEQAVQVMRAGKHVFMEKPVGMNSEEAKELHAIALRENVKIGVGMMMRFHTHHQFVKKIIAEDKLGDIVSMRAQFTCWYPEAQGEWRQIKKLSGGGALMDLGVHCLDLLQYVSGTKAVGVTAICDTLSFKYEVDDSASLLLKMNNGAHAYVDVNFNIPDNAAVSRLEIYGTKGSFIADGTIGQEEIGSARVSLVQESEYDAMQNRDGGSFYHMPPANGNMYTKEIESFSAALLKDTDPEVTIEDAIFVQEITEAAYQSAEEGRHMVIKSI